MKPERIEELVKQLGSITVEGTELVTVLSAKIAVEDAIQESRRQALQECWEKVNSIIKQGTLPGNGCDETAQRNGLILATNTIMSLMESGKPIDE